MHVVRPARFADLPGIERLLEETEARVTTLPKDRDKLSEQINDSTDSFDRALETAEPSSFLFVAEETDNKELIATSGIDTSAGNGYPFFNYRLDEIVHASHHLNIRSNVPALFLSHELTGQTLLRSMTIQPQHKGSDAFDLIARARLMFMASHADAFDKNIIVEVQGMFDDKGVCPFWDAVGRKFFDLDFFTVDYYCSVKSKTFMSELFPQHPVYLPLLPKKAVESIAQHHPAANRTCQLLYREGFKTSKFIDPVDGGPVLSAEFPLTHTAQNIRFKKARPSNVIGGLKYLICNQSVSDFRCVIGTLVDGIGENIRISLETAEALGVESGEAIAYAPL